MGFRTCTWCGHNNYLDSQTIFVPYLTSITEANLTKLCELLGWLTPAEAICWADIKATFARNLCTSSGGQLLQVLTQLENISGGIREALGRE